MSQHTLFSCGKKIVFGLAALCSASAFAATCPSVDEIHPNNTGQWVTNSGWVSTSPGSANHPIPVEFMSAYIPNHTYTPGNIDPIKRIITYPAITGNMVCRYKSKTTSAPVPVESYITLERPHTIAIIEMPKYSGWVTLGEWTDWSGVVIIETPPYLEKGERYAFCSKDCQFELGSNVANPF